VEAKELSGYCFVSKETNFVVSVKVKVIKPSDKNVGEKFISDTAIPAASGPKK